MSQVFAYGHRYDEYEIVGLQGQQDEDYFQDCSCGILEKKCPFHQYRQRFHKQLEVCMNLS